MDTLYSVHTHTFFVVKLFQLNDKNESMYIHVHVHVHALGKQITILFINLFKKHNTNIIHKL